MTHLMLQGRRLTVGLLLASCACINVDQVFYETELRASVVYPPGLTQASALHVEVHHAQFGGALSHPLGLIERFEYTGMPESFEELVLVPREEGEGLVVYAWVDVDGDGVLCGLGGEGDEAVGIIELDAFPAHLLEFELSLDASCLGPERLYP